MNVLVENFINKEDKKVFEKNMLFATLETYVRNIKLHNNKSFLLYDTVGFVGDLPHNLVKAFRSTLEEVCDADLLVHIIDISNPNYKNQIDVTNETLSQIGADNIPMIYVYNKIDLIDLDKLDNNKILISAKRDIGIDRLIESICEKVFEDYIRFKLKIPYSEGKMISNIMENATILDSEYIEDGVILNIECSEKEYVQYKQYII